MSPLRIASLVLVVIIAAGLLPVPTDAASVGLRRGSELLAFGRVSTTSPTQDGKTARALLQASRERLATDATLRTIVAARAQRDATGETSPRDLAVDPSGPLLYFEHVSAHVKRFAADESVYREVIDRAYQFVLGRPAYDIEFDYWKARAPLPYYLLCACIDHWAGRNAPGLMFTTGTPTISITSRYLVVERLSPGEAIALREATGLAVTGDPGMAAALDRAVVAPGAGEITSVGGIHLVAVGLDRD
ncbi:hypothetical protein ASA1KI_40590 [Opitutales bacterium ASA1]|uniref:hypothetical protein n=1 Tax=Congregicoccus parvus TaxID=3081749 RepID=UPI002B2B92B1|nr:hypothetical protein ASA1KI_40590 [Opitutales bacterium ASA1]